MDATIIIGVFGDIRYWLDIARANALPSARKQGCRVILSAGNTLAEARNSAVRGVETEWLIFLDADDELSDGYVESLLAGEGDLRAPAVKWDDAEPVLLDDRDIEQMNPCVIGTAIRTKLFMELGGFQEFSAWEDYALFLKAYRRGATITHNPAAVYVVHSHKDSRNNTVQDPGTLFNSIHLASWDAS